jgi:PAS domain S-box-containing protein
VLYNGLAVLKHTKLPNPLLSLACGWQIMLSQSIQSFDDFFDANRQFTVILDSHGRTLIANNAALELIGKSKDEIVNSPFWELPQISSSSINRQILKRSVDQALIGKTIRTELTIHHRKRPDQILEFSLEPFFNNSDVLEYIFVEGCDITLPRNTRQALGMSEELFRIIYEKSAMGILIKGVDGKLVDSNPAFQSMLGFSADEILKLDYLAITHPLDRKDSLKLFTALISGENKSYLTEKRYLSKDGNSVWVRVNSSLVYNSESQPQFVITMVENITTQKQIETEMAELRLRLMQGREMERLKLAQDLHDGPLQEIIGLGYLLQSLETAGLSVSGLEELNNIQATVQALTETVRGMCGELRPPTLIPFGLGKAITSHAEGIQKKFPELNIRVDLVDDSFQISEQIRVVLFRIFQEAINNVLRHSHADLIDVRLWREGQQLCLEIQDNGVGFELPARWIKLARQGHLGLVGARERALEIGGSLEVKTAPSKGTLVRAIVPESLEQLHPAEE